MSAEPLMHRYGSQQTAAVPTTRAAWAYDELKRRIVRLELPPGQELSEAEMARLLDVGKTPVREALGRLRRDGFVTVAARSGYRVTPVTLDDARELISLRVLLEGEGAALAAVRIRRIGELEKLAKACDVDYEPTDPHNIEEFLELNRRFHEAVVAAAEHDRLLGIFKDVLQQMNRLFHLGLRSSVRLPEASNRLAAYRDGHRHLKRRLILALAQAEPEEARRVVEQQCKLTERLIIEALLLTDGILDAGAEPPSSHAGSPKLPATDARREA